jgi:hypothetical protein
MIYQWFIDNLLMLYWWIISWAIRQLGKIGWLKTSFFIYDLFMIELSSCSSTRYDNLIILLKFLSGWFIDDFFFEPFFN